jgi:secreted trypsin-like serine protease
VEASGGNINDYMGLPGGEHPGFDSPGNEGNSAVSAGSGKPIFVKKHHAEVALGVVGGYDEPAVHVGVAAWFVN